LAFGARIRVTDGVMVSISVREILSVLPLIRGNSPEKLRHTRFVAYSVELVLLNKHQISGGGAYLDCYPR